MASTMQFMALALAMVMFALVGRMQSYCKKAEREMTHRKKVEEAINKLEGIRCGYKSTSCPDQLAQALKETL